MSGRTVVGSGAAAMAVTVRWMLRGLGRRWLLALGFAVALFAWRAGAGSGGARRAAWVEFADLFVAAFAIALGASALSVLRGRRRAGPLEAAPVVGPAWFVGSGVALAGAVCALALGLAAIGSLALREPLRATASVPAARYAGTTRWISGDEFAAARDGRIAWSLGSTGPDERWSFVTRLRLIYHRLAQPAVPMRIEGPGIDVRFEATAERPVEVALPPGFAGGELTLSAAAGPWSVRALEPATFLRADASASPTMAWIKFAIASTSRALLLLVVAFGVSILTAPAIAAAGAATFWAAGWVAPFLRDLSAHSMVPSIVRARVAAGPATEPVRSRTTWFFDWVPDLRSGASAERILQGLTPTWSDIAGEIAPRLLLAAGLAIAAAALTRLVWRRSLALRLGEGAHGVGWSP